MYYFHTSCVNSTAELIESMVDQAIETTYKELLFNCHDIHDIEESIGYDLDTELRLHNDYTVSFWRSKYEEKDCYYFQHSCIEYIFL